MRIVTVTRTLLLLAFVSALAGCVIRPQPLVPEEVARRVDSDRTAMFAGQEPVDGPISLSEAMARALKYNLDHRLKRMEAVLADADLAVARFEQLPELAAAAGYRHRDNYSGSSSEALTGPGAGTESLVASTSQERDLLTTDVTVVWNVLDFGVSYVRACQQADRRLIAAERRRKVVHNILQDVRSAYWRAASAQVLLDDLVTLRRQAQSALDRSQQIARRRLGAPREALEYQRALLENIRLLWELIQRLTPAKTELAALMNLDPGADFTLAAPDWEASALTLVEMPSEELEAMALEQRPELLEEDFKARIGRLQTRKTLLEMLPGLDLRFGYNTDSNAYLYNNDWWQAGVKVSTNLMQLLSGPATYRAAKAREQVDELRRHAVSMAVLTQVHLARQQYGLVQEELAVARRLDDVSRRLQQQVTTARDAGRGDDLTVIRTTTQAMVASLRHHLAFAALENAAARIYHSAGVDVVPVDVAAEPLATVAAAIENGYQRYEIPAPTADSQVVETPAPSAPDSPPGPRPAAEPIRASGEAPASEPEEAGGTGSESMSQPAAPPTASPPTTDPSHSGTGDATGDGSQPAVVAGSRVNLRAAPDPAAAVLHRVAAAGTPSTVLEREGDWYRVRVEGHEGWMFHNLVALSPPPDEDAAQTNADRVNVRRHPWRRAPRLCRIEAAGTPVRIEGRRRDWLLVSGENVSGWVYGAYIDPPTAGSEGVPLRVDAYGVRLRAAPDEDAAVVGAVDNRGTVVRLLERRPDWVRVRAGALKGWMAERFVEEVR